MIAVWFSCGAASAAALKLTLERFPSEDVRAINQPIAEEHPDNQRFLDDVAAWCGIEIERYTACKFPSGSAVEVWEKAKAMAFPHGAPCTQQLKKNARQEWEQINKPDWHVLGFTAEEQERHDRFTLTERSNVIPVLIDAAMTKADCGDMIRAAGIKLPAVYDHGLPNANCLGCVKATSPTYWNHIRREFPDVFEARRGAIAPPWCPSGPRQRRENISRRTRSSSKRRSYVDNAAVFSVLRRMGRASAKGGMTCTT